MSSNLLWAGLVVLPVVLFIYIYFKGGRYWDKRRSELARWAHAKGWTFSPDRNDCLCLRFPLFRLLHEGYDRYAFNIMRGGIGARAVCAFDFQYTVGGGRSRRTYLFSAVVIEAGLPLKPLFIRPETLFDKAGEFVGLDDIDFESAEFSRKFFVKSPDRQWAYSVLPQKTMEVILRYPGFHFCVEFLGSEVVLYSAFIPFSAKDFEHALEMVTGILDNLPESVVRELKETAAGGVTS